MARPAYSFNFGRAPSLSTGPVAMFAVPTNRVAVVKCLTITYGNVIASGMDAWFQDDAGCKLARYTWAFSAGSPTNYGGTALFFGDWVLNEGDVLNFQVNAGTADLSASGYLLSADGS
jgi:hypothetical protein